MPADQAVVPKAELKRYTAPLLCRSAGLLNYYLPIMVWVRTTVAVGGQETMENRINPRKLLNSKWTAVQPARKEKHYLVTDVEFDEEGLVIYCAIEAVISKRSMPIEWQELKDRSQWSQGWK